MANYKNPGIYAEEISVFPPFVVEVETTLPAFIGYTETAKKFHQDDLIMVPTKVNSIKEYELYFGNPFDNEIEIDIITNSSGLYVLSGYKQETLRYLLHYSLRIYFENGGTPCYILSVGTYQVPQHIILSQSGNSETCGLLDGLRKLADVADLSLIVIPEAVRLSEMDYATIVQEVLLQCNLTGNRFAIFDLYQGDHADPDLVVNREYFGSKHLDYGSVYYPFVHTRINCYVNAEESNVMVRYDGIIFRMHDLKNTNKRLYKFVKGTLKRKFVDLPSCAVVAGAYVKTDKEKGVWKSPANFSLTGVSEPVVSIDNRRQDSLNMDPDTGKSINSIRSFSGKGTLVWGARTLAGNDNEWRYVPVRRFFIMVKESLKRSTSWVVFEPNNAKTWLKVCMMIENYLTQKWKEGALAGITPNTAFFVKCGQGATMNALDLFEGRIIIEVGLAILRPAEFIIFRITHQIQHT